VREEWNHTDPVAAPGLSNGRKLRIPLQTKLSQSLFRLRCGRGTIDFKTIYGAATGGCPLRKHQDTF